MSFAGVASLQQASDWRKVATAAIQDVERRRVALRSEQDALRQLRMLDAMSNRMCAVVDSAELCRSAHPDREWRDEASAAFESCCEYMEELNVDEALHACARDASRLKGVPEEALALAMSFKAEFERDGIHLGRQERARVAQAKNEIRGLEHDLLNETSQSAPLAVANDAANVKRALRDLGPYAYLFSVSRDETVLWTVEDEGAMMVVRLVADRGARSRAFKHLRRQDRRRRECVDALAVSRAQLAAALGARSFAHSVLRGPPEALVSDEKMVATFVTEAAQHVKARVRVELDALASTLKGGPVRPCDVEFARASLAGDPLFIEVDRCVEALIAATRILFPSIRVAVVATEHVWDSSVRRLDVFDGGERLGVAYLDLEARPGKVTGAAHFTVRGGCSVTPDDAPRIAESDFFRVDRQASSWGFDQQPLRQLPTVALVCSFAPLLSHADLETLLHEWGHALHSLLSETTAQHLSGTRGATDVVELASTLVEGLAWHAPLLRTALDGDANQALAGLRRARAATRGLDAHRQLRLAAFDQALHGNTHMADTTVTFDAAALVASNVVDDPPALKDTHDFLRLDHIATAPATYYVRAVASFLDRVTSRRPTPTTKRSRRSSPATSLPPQSPSLPGPACGAFLVAAVSEVRLRRRFLAAGALSRAEDLVGDVAADASKLASIYATGGDGAHVQS